MRLTLNAGNQRPSGLREQADLAGGVGELLQAHVSRDGLDRHVAAVLQVADGQVLGQVVGDLGGQLRDHPALLVDDIRSEARRVGKEGVSTVRSWWAPLHSNNKVSQNSTST